jgi:autotransporter-associated beta strand protein
MSDGSSKKFRHAGAAALALQLIAAKCGFAAAPDGTLVQFNDNGFWSWFQDERAIIDPRTGQLLIGSVASGDGAGGAARDGNVDVVAYNLASGAISRSTLIDFSYLADDHFSPALLVRPDGRYLAVYCAHQNDNLIRWRVSTNPGDASSWSPEQSLSLTSNQGTTYSNAYYLSGTGRTYDFFRGNNYDPHLLGSADSGSTWSYTGHLLMDPANGSNLRPYLKYTSNGVDRVYFISTETHPRESNTGIWAGYITPANGNVYRIDGTAVGTLGTNTGTAVSVQALSPVFPANSVVDGTARTNAWTTDLALDNSGNPYTVFTSRVAGNNLDHRFYYARWTGSSFAVHEIAKAGGYLYSAEGDYTGLAALSPSDPNTLYISTKIDPRDGTTTTSKYEIYRGFTTDTGSTWTWVPITASSTLDNLRPIVPRWDATHTALLWFRGTYTTYQHANSAVVGKFYTGNNGAWRNAAGGAWASGANWMENTADGMSFIADFSTIDIAGNVNVALSGQHSLGFLTFGDTNPSSGGSWNINGGTIVLDAGVVAPVIAVRNQSATIASVLSGSQGLTKTGAGSLRLEGANNYAGATQLEGGTLTLARAAWDPVLTGAGGAVVNRSRLIFDYTGGASPAGTIQGMLTSAYAGGFSSGQIRSSAANSSLGLGWADDTAGQRVSVAYTYYGDANLDGKVDTLDFNSLAANFGGTDKSWMQGDFNYDGTVDMLDFNFLAANFGQTLAGAPDSGGGNISGAVLLPEPVVGLTALFIFGSLAARRRRRRGD